MKIMLKLSFVDIYIYAVTQFTNLSVEFTCEVKLVLITYLVSLYVTQSYQYTPAIEVVVLK